MSKMKELFMQERYEQGHYLQDIIPDLEYDMSKETRIPCPNCDSETLEMSAADEMTCPCCGHTFELIDKTTLKFK